MMGRDEKRLFQRLCRAVEVAVPGTLAEVRLRCGTPSCGCHRDPALRHGPHLYVKYRNRERRSTAVYVPRSAETEVRSAVAAWAEAWRILVAIGEKNLEALRQRVRRGAKLGTRKSRRGQGRREQG
jgi:hypothetical protein